MAIFIHPKSTLDLNMRDSVYIYIHSHFSKIFIYQNGMFIETTTLIYTNKDNIHKHTVLHVFYRSVCFNFGQVYKIIYCPVVPLCNISN